MEHSHARAWQAGEAFKRRLESDPNLQARWNAARERIAAVAELFKSEVPELEKARADWRDEFTVDFPSDIEGWIRLATRAGVPFERVQASTPDGLLPWIEGYLQRLKDQKGPESTPINVDNVDKLKSIAKKTDAPRDVRLCAEYITRERAKIASGKRRKASERALILEFVRSEDLVDAMVKQLSPKRYGHLIGKVKLVDNVDK